MTSKIVPQQFVFRCDGRSGRSLPSVFKLANLLIAASSILRPNAAFSASADAPSLLKAPFDAPTAKNSQQDWARHLKREPMATNSLGMKLTLIPPGEYLMGSPAEEKRLGKHPEEELQHRVRITKPFYLGVHDVTLGNFLAFCNAAKYKTEAESDGKGGFVFNPNAEKFLEQKPEFSFRNCGIKQTSEHPVVNVTWNDAQAFCTWLSKNEGKKYRLPTEAEWEYACRAGTTTSFNFGSSCNGREANCDGSEVLYGTQKPGPFVMGTTAVGSYQPNAFGLYDMHGNVCQWCQDWYDKDYYSASTIDDPPGPKPSLLRIFHVIRGGGWDSAAPYCRSADRARGDDAMRFPYLGFRVVRDE